MMDAVKLLKIPEPEYIRWNLMESSIWFSKGGSTVLPNLKEVLIEIDEGFEKQSVDSVRHLYDAGLVLKEKRQSDMFKDSDDKTVYNQIWHRFAAK